MRQTSIRLFVDAGLVAGVSVELSAAQAHYVLNVMRLKAGDTVSAFNGSDGEWRATVDVPAKRRVTLTPTDALRPQTQDLDLWLVFAPIKRVDMVVEKATELGASELFPVMTRHTDVTRVNLDRLRANAVEAAEQCERLSVPVMHPSCAFDTFLATWPPARTLYFLDETGGGVPIAEALAPYDGTPCGFLVGPAGGFAQSELDALRQLPSARGVDLGPRILRAETAACAALACWQALSGDWRAKTREG